ncbi:MAG: hypothetical protein SWH68_16460, partial [Thermodesulfobacteriota bacterium]|nr:hypothetical protein [Thermodesulfobacteriota bacterium]
CVRPLIGRTQGSPLQIIPRASYWSQSRLKPPPLGGQIYRSRLMFYAYIFVPFVLFVVINISSKAGVVVEFAIPK